MLKYIKQLEESDFVDLLVAIKQMRYGDSSRLYEYLDKEDRRVVHLWDNGGSFKDNGQDYIWVNDYETSNPSFNFNHNVFMLSTFGPEWYARAQKYFEGKKPESLEILSRAKGQYDKDLEADKEFIFNKKDYSTDEDFYKDIAIKMDAIKIDDYYDSSTFEYNANILWEFLSCEFGYAKKNISIILKNFNIEDMKPDKKYDDYQYFYIIKVLKRFIEYFPSSTLEFVNDEN